MGKQTWRVNLEAIPKYLPGEKNGRGGSEGRLRDHSFLTPLFKELGRFVKDIEVQKGGWARG